MASLATVLEYANENVVSRFSEDHKVSIADATEIFTETKRWLWLCAKRQIAENSGTASPMRVPLFNEAYAIDLMWHTFLLHTEDYAKFCDKHFGFFIHHHPKPLSEKLEWRARIECDPEGARRERIENLSEVYDYLYDELGPETLVKWCEEFPARFQF